MGFLFLYLFEVWNDFCFNKKGYTQLELDTWYLLVLECPDQEVRMNASHGMCSSTAFQTLRVVGR